jgi:hypothetical protein
VAPRGTALSQDETAVRHARRLYNAAEQSADAGSQATPTVEFLHDDLAVREHGGDGVRTVGTRQRIGQHHGRRRDVVPMERRSSVVC